MIFTPEKLALVCAATTLNAARYVEHLNAAMAHYEIDTTARAAMFLAQIAYESKNLECVEENLSYSPKRLMAVWPRRFPTLVVATQYARKPEKLANYVYANRLGNGDAASGDGWRYRGRGLKQLTGKANYMEAEEGLGMVITGGNAWRVASAQGAAWTAAWYWYRHQLNRFADTDNLEGCTLAINGGLTGYEDGNDTGLDDRVELWEYTSVKIKEIA